jgi:hypothetical protein
MKILIGAAGFTVIFSISMIATIRPEVFSFVRQVSQGDKIAHFLLFGMLAWLCVLQAWKSGCFFVGPGIALTVVYAIADELTQLFFDSRSFSLLDLIADLAGIVIFSSAAIIYSVKAPLGKTGKGNDEQKSLGQRIWFSIYNLQVLNPLKMFHRSASKKFR